MAITDRNITTGDQVTANYKRTTYRAEAFQEGEEGLRFRVTEPFMNESKKSLSALGTLVTGNACNGWVFWSRYQGEQPEPANLHQATEQGAPKPKAARRAKAEPKVKAAPKPRRARNEPTPPGAPPALPIINQTDDTFECGECFTRFTNREEAIHHLAETHGIQIAEETIVPIEEEAEAVAVA